MAKGSRIETQQAPVVVQSPPVRERTGPQEYRPCNRLLLCCQACGANRQADGGHCLESQGIHGGLAYFRCRICGARSKFQVMEGA